MAKKEMDKLEQEVHQALAAGLSYGKWKAMQTPVKIEPKPDLFKYPTKKCEYCDTEFYVDNNNRKYCCVRCKQLAHSKKMRDKYRGHKDGKE